MLRLDAGSRSALWEQLIDRIEQYIATVDSLRVAPPLDPTAVRCMLAGADFEKPWSAEAAVDFAVDGLTRYQVHTPHPRYFGLFNPAPTTMGVAADALVAAFNPQIAAWSHSPFAAEVENHLIRALGSRFGYDPVSTDGVFASGGMEANHTALLAALTYAFPGFGLGGARSLPGDPVLYVSAEVHHSFPKAAKMCGLGLDSVRHFRHIDDLPGEIAADREADRLPFLIVGTAGTTNAGTIEPLAELAAISQREGLWFHVDAAWGGAAAIVPELRPLLNGIERADSITFDAHKWMSVPMGAGVFLTRHQNILSDTFRMVTAYMPKEAAGLDIVDPHQHSMQWSRRFIGLKLFLSLLVAGWEGYAEAIRHQVQMGCLLAEKLTAAGWTVFNNPQLAVVCFGDSERDAAWHHEIAMRVVGSGEGWISTTLLAGARTVLRACITNYGTQPEHLDQLVETLDVARGGQKKRTA